MKPVSDWDKMLSKLSDTFTMEQICKTLDIVPWKTRYINPEYYGGFSMPCHQFEDHVLSVAQQFFNQHSLALYRVSPGLFKVSPASGHTWKTAADSIRKTINTFGMFHFSGLRSFLSSGPYTPKQAVLVHLHWISESLSATDGASPNTLVENRLNGAE